MLTKRQKELLMEFQETLDEQKDKEKDSFWHKIKDVFEKSIKDEIEDIKKSVDELESKPDPNRAKPVTYIESPLAKSAGNNDENMSKSEVLQILEQELYKATGNITSNEILTYEVSGIMTPKIARIMKNK